MTGSSIFFNMTSVPLCLRFVFQRTLNPIISFCFWLISSPSFTVQLQKECYAGVQSWPKAMLQVHLNTPVPITQCKNSLLKRRSIDTSFNKVIATRIVSRQIFKSMSNSPPTSLQGVNLREVPPELFTFFPQLRWLDLRWDFTNCLTSGKKISQA